MAVDLSNEDLAKFSSEMAASHEAFVADQRELRRKFSDRSEAVQDFVSSRLEEIRGRDNKATAGEGTGETVVAE